MYSFFDEYKKVTAKLCKLCTVKELQGSIVFLVVIYGTDNLKIFFNRFVFDWDDFLLI